MELESQPGEIGSMSIVGLDFSDARWAGLLGGYRVPYDPRKALRALEQGDGRAAAWDELWNELHHQGDIGEASFAALPHLVRIHECRGVPDWNTYAIAAIIELARDSADNPQLPPDLQQFYETAWKQLIEIGLQELNEAEDETLVTGILAVLAIGKGMRMLGRLTIEFTDDERKELLAKVGWL
jgi:hypothetical protein